MSAPCVLASLGARDPGTGQHYRPHHSLFGAAASSGLERGQRDCRRLDRRLAVRAHLPERLERRLAVHARLLELRRADRTHKELVRDLGPADRAIEIAACQPLLHRFDLELSFAHVLEVLRRTEEHVHERADVGNDQPDRDRGRDQHRVLDSALGVLVDPVAHGEPERDQEEEEQIPDHLPGTGGEEVVDAGEGAGGHRSILPITYPARNASPTIAARTKAAKAKTISLSPTFAIARSHPWLDRPGGKGTR